jgi:hypothetical protein
MFEKIVRVRPHTLSEKQPCRHKAINCRAFAREPAAGKKPLDAALAAGYPDSNCAPRNARRRAARADVKAMVAELRAPVADKLEIALSLLIERADQIFKQAMAAGRFNAAISALKELGVLSGKRIERSERGEPGEFDHMSDEEFARGGH